MKYLSVFAVLAFFFQTSNATEQWWPSKWGEGDTLGSFNMLGPELTLKAAKLVKSGKTYRLGIETNADTPAVIPRTFELHVVYPSQYNGASLGENKFNFFDDIISGWVGVGSQIDGLGHAATDGIFYNGFKSHEFAKVDGLTKMGTEKYPPIVSRGVLLDMAACAGVKVLSSEHVYTKKNIIECEQKQGIEIERGDVVLFHSGWMQLVENDPERYGKINPGLGADGAHYLVNKDVLAVGADTFALEVLPPEDPKILYPVHQILLNYAGVYILENMDTRELSKDKAYEFMFVLGPARMTGAVQMIINPIAIR